MFIYKYVIVTLRNNCTASFMYNLRHKVHEYKVELCQAC